jgi:hypothetical protein
MLGKIENKRVHQYQSVTVRTQVYWIGTNPQALGVMFIIIQARNRSDRDIPGKILLQFK